jgi:hypothetical protein
MPMHSFSGVRPSCTAAIQVTGTARDQHSPSNGLAIIRTNAATHSFRVPEAPSSISLSADPVARHAKAHTRA